MQTLTKIDESDLYNFVIQTIETEKGVKIGSPIAYAKRCVSNNPDQWRSRYAASQKTIGSQKDFILQDWQIRQAIALALQNQDYEYAIATFKKYPELHDQILNLHPEWSERLTGVKRERANTDKSFLNIKLAMLKAKVKLRLSEEQILKTREQIKSLERLVALSVAIAICTGFWSNVLGGNSYVQL